MLMDSLEEVMDTQLIIKGKRTKRQIPPSQLTLTTASSSSCFADAGGGSGGIVSDDSDEFAESAQEEEKDMANCLILLAQGRRHRQKLPSEAMAATAGYVFRCNTCGRCFPSFQALGGHRASHKKPKPKVEDEKKLPSLMEEEDDHQFNKTSTTRVLCSTTNSKSKVHKCSVCGVEFASGQALGGHMRRHRAFMSRGGTAASTTMISLSSSSSPDQSQDAEKPRNVVQLDIDLNLPAPEDDHSESKLFSFKSKEQVIVFSESSLVDCL